MQLLYAGPAPELQTATQCSQERTSEVVEVCW